MTNASIAKVKNEAPSFGIIILYIIYSSHLLIVAEDASDSEGEGEKPLTLEEFKLKAKDKIEVNLNLFDKE